MLWAVSRIDALWDRLDALWDMGLLYPRLEIFVVGGWSNIEHIQVYYTASL